MTNAHLLNPGNPLLTIGWRLCPPGITAIPKNYFR